MPVRDKLIILHYCLSDDSYHDLIGLELLPMVDSNFCQFKSPNISSTIDNIYVCTESFPSILLPELQHILVSMYNSDSLLHSKLIEVATNKCTQLKMLNVPLIADLLQYCNTSSWSNDQMSRFWKWLYNQPLQYFRQKMIVPVKLDTGCTIIKSLDKQNGVVYVSQSFSHLTVLMSALIKCNIMFANVSDLPFLVHSQLNQYLNHFIPDDVLDALQYCSLGNVTLPIEEAKSIQSFLSSSNNIMGRSDVVCSIPMFSVIQNNMIFSINALRSNYANNRAIVIRFSYGFEPGQLPIDPLLLSPQENNETLLLKLQSDVQFMSEIDYFEKILFPQIRKDPEDLNTLHLMLSILNQFELLRRANSSHRFQQFVHALSNLPFIEVSSYNFQPPQNLFDPEIKLIKELYRGEVKFPNSNYKSYLPILRQCGLKTSITATDLLEVIKSIQQISSQHIVCSNETNFRRAIAVLQYLIDNPSTLNHSVEVNTSLVNSLINNESCWFPVVCNPPQQYPSCLTWKGSSYPQALVSPCYTPLVALSKDITSSQLPMIAGSCTVFIEHVPNQIAQRICSLPKDIVKAVISHFKHIIHNKDNISLDMLEELAFQTYSYLQSNISYCDINVYSETEKWIWLEKYSTFVSPSQVAITPCPSFRASLEPFQFTLSSRWQRFSQLFTKLGVPQELTADQIQNVLYSIKQNSTVVSSDVAWSIVKSILDWIVEDCLRINDNVMVPVESDSEYPDLQPIDSVAYTDNDILRDIASASDENYFIIHPKVAYLAPPLGLIPLSDQLDITEDVFEDAGQHEPLTTRLRNILKEYKDGLTIIKEMIQNADDAEATEVNILYDTRTYTTENLILKGMADSHGPALIIHNNSTFSDEDFKDITKLAGATKSDKPLKIGKFGVGFCSVYHITDVPSFVSGEWLYIFDPTLQYLKGVVRNENQPGKKMKYMSKFLARSNQLAPYKNLFGFSSSKLYNGTMFRFPFRTNPSEICSTRYNEHLISQLKQDLANNGSKLLLFLQNIKKITFSSIQNNELVMELSIECITDGGLIKCITKSIDSEDTVEYWLISSHNQTLIQDNKTVPATASVACQLSIDELSNTFVCKSIEGELFCFLPLSVPATGLPVHVSANFAVMSNRSGIWTTSSSEIPSDPREHWNQTLMTSVVPYCYCNLLLKVKEMYLNRQISSYEFYSLWPLDVLLQTKYPWLTLNSNLYKLIYQNKLLYSTSLRQWLILSESRFLSQSLSTGCELLHDDITCIHKAVTCLKLPVVFVPQHYLQQIQTTISPHSISYIEQVDFTSLFLSNISHFITDIDNHNKVLLHILSWVIMEQDCNSKLQELLKQYPCIPCCPNGVTLKLASQLIDPNVYNDMFDSKDEMFPVSTFIENTLIYQVMIKLGLLQSNIPSSIIISSARTVQSLFSQNRESGLQRIKLLIKCIEESHQYFASKVEICLLKKIPFLPVLPKPENYILPWKGDGHLLLPASQLVAVESRDLWKCAVTVGSQRAIVDTRRDYGCGSIALKVLSLLDIPTRPSLDDVLNHFECLIDKTMCDDSEVVIQIQEICSCVYEYLNDELQSQEKLNESEQTVTLPGTVSTAEKRLSVYTDKPFIWTSNCFAVPCDVAKNWKGNCSPYLYKLPDILSQQTLLLDVLKIKDDFTIHKLLAVFSTMKGNADSKQVPPNYHCLCDDIILELNKFSVTSEELNDVILVDQDYVLRSAKHLSYNDVPWLPAVATDGCHFVHPKLNRDVAVKLGVVPTKTKFLDSFRSPLENFNGDPFGQNEKITDRIKNILCEYPLDVTLLKELIQNADDAKATKMCVILDTRYHKRERVLSEEWKELQGPALLVWNDKDFTDEDLKGIQKLGIGSKRDDDESIGQFGIGFNVVYHITDCPSFITRGNILCVFDPHCRYVPGANPLCPGRQYDRLDQLFWSSMSDLHTTYLLDNLPNKPPGLNSGVLFRLPLRCTSEQVLNSKLVNEPADVLTAKVMEQHLDNWMPSIKDALIFLNNLTQFEFYVINEKSEFICKTSLSVCLTERDNQKRSSMKQVFSEFKKSKQCQQIMYPLTIKSNEDEEHWLIQQGVGDMNDPTKEWIFLKHTLPKYGIAAPLHKPQTLNGQVFCFLPLPEYTGLSVHINGQFALTSNRRSLWNSTTDEADNKTKWNNDLIKAIAYSYAQFLCEARQYYISNERYKSSKEFYDAVDSYYSLFPFWKGEDKHRSIDWKGIGSMVFEYLWSINAPVLVSEINHLKFISAQWHILYNEINPNQQAYFLPKTRLDKKLQKILRSIGMILTCAPYTLYEHLKEHEPAIVNKKSVYNYYKCFHHLVIATCPCSIQNTPFQSPQTFCLFLKYLLAQHGTIQYKFPDDDVPTDTPLLLTADSQLRAFSNSQQTLHSSYCFLFPQSSSMFLHSNLLSICPEHYFASNTTLKVINGIILSNYPQDLHQLDVVNNTNIDIEVLKQLWECFHYDPVFSFHKYHIVNSWAIIPSCCGKLYRSSSKILPVVSPKPTKHQIYQDAFELITSLGVSKLNPDFEEYASNYCIEVTYCVGILSVLYHLHIQENVLCNLTNPTKTISTLFNYFSRINYFGFNHESLTYIKSLPLFETVNNDKLTSIVGKSLYLWPLNFCMSGIEKWAPPTQIIFLERNGRWKQLCNFQTLGCKQLSEREIYTMIIFPKFCDLTAKERKEHLQYIRDNMYHDVSLDMQYTYEWYRRDSASKFLSELKCLPCIESEDGVLQRASFFCNHKIPIFQSFSHHFHFLPDEFDDDKWIKFFCFIGLRQTVTLEEFKKFCKEISVGNHQSIAHASNVLVEYLFSKSAKGWHTDNLVLSEIGNICFVVVDPLRDLQWIKESCQPPHYFQSQKVGLTKLNEAVIYDSASIVWTIKPVVSLPYPDPLVFRSKDEYNDTLRKIGVTIRPSVEDVYQNLINVSETGLVDFSLFEKYRPDYVRKGDDNEQVSIKDVIKQSLNYLFANKANNYLRQLAAVPCIPVSAYSASYGDIDTPVLVKPLQVVRHIPEIYQSLFPHVHKLPSFMNALNDGNVDLELIGVSESITIKTMQHMLEFMYQQYSNSQLDPNNIGRVRTAICKIHELCNDSTAVHDIAPLYYPNEAHRLVDTTELFFIDSDRYKEISFLKSKYSLFQMPQQIHEIKRLTGFTMIKQLPNEKDICLLLPKEVRPQGISLVCTEEIANNNSEYSRDCPLFIHFQNLKLIAPSIQQLMCKVLAGTVENVTEFCTSFIDLIIKMDICVRPHLMCNVKVDSCLIDTIKVSYILQKTQENYILYVDLEDTPGYTLKKNLAHSLCVEIAHCHKMEPTSYLEAVVHVREFLGIQCQNDLSEIFEKYSIKDQCIEISLRSDSTPVPGKEIPEGLRALLYEGDINHIFTPEEWVGYEISEGVIIFAIVLYPLLPQDNYDLLSLKYKILMDDSETGEITVTALDIYKFKAPTLITETDSQELVPSNSTSALAKLTDSYSYVLDIKESTIQRKPPLLHTLTKVENLLMAIGRNDLISGKNLIMICC